jgi:hypothetical protein
MDGGAMIGKYFIGVHDEALHSGIIEAQISDHYYLVRFDGFTSTDGPVCPERLAVIPVANMVGRCKDCPPSWDLFDTIEQRAAYQAWLDEPSADKPRVVQIRSLQ